MEGALISHGSVAFHVYKWYDYSLGSAGLSIVQWGISIAIGSGSLIIRMLMKFIPEDKCLQVFKWNLGF